MFKLNYKSPLKTWQIAGKTLGVILLHLISRQSFFIKKESSFNDQTPGTLESGSVSG
jgi:hypothetical protein